MSMIRERLTEVETSEVKTPDVEELESMWREGDEDAEASVEEDPRKSRGLLAAWIVVMFGILLFEPAPSDPAAPIPAWGGMLLFAFTGALVATLVGLGQGRPWRFKASAAAAGLGLGVAFGCAATDHHAGTWWLAEAGAFTGLLGATGLTARRSR